MDDPIRGKVAKVLNSREVAINLGSEQGVRPGMYFASSPGMKTSWTPTRKNRWVPSNARKSG